jgi:hypothetical protein
VRPVPKPTGAWSVGVVGFLAAALFCFEKQIRQTVAAETEAASWARVVEDVKVTDARTTGI